MSRLDARRKNPVVEKEVPGQPGKTYLAREIPGEGGGTPSSSSGAPSSGDKQYQKVKIWADRYNQIVDGVRNYRPGNGSQYLKDIQGLIGDYYGIKGVTGGSLDKYWRNLFDIQKAIHDTERERGRFDSEDAYLKYLYDQAEYQRRQDLWTNQTNRLEEQQKKLETQAGDSNFSPGAINQRENGLREEIRKIDSRLAMSENSYLGMPMSKEDKRFRRQKRKRCIL